jgi:hypothetical protein
MCFPCSARSVSWLSALADLSIFAAAGMVCLATAADAHASSSTLEIVARITPTAARPEPVRDFTFYILTKSYADITKEVEAGDMVPSRSEFIDGLDVSPELKEWLKAHDILDLALPDMDKFLTPEDILKVPEFLLAYQRANGGGVTKGMPNPRYQAIDQKAHADKYAKGKEDYYAALKKFIRQNPSTISGVELELDAVNPQRKWTLLHTKHAKRTQKMAPEIAQTKYLAAKVDTDLDGHASISGLAPGNYWISSLNLDANAGDSRVRWDVPITIQAGRNQRIELTNLNATDTLAASVP